MAKRKKGRSGKYNEWLKEDNLILLEAWARDGLTDEQISHNIGINPKTLYEWKKKHDPISKALKRGKQVTDIIIENALFKSAIGYEYEEVKQIIEKDEMGKDRKRVEKITKYSPPNTTAIIFWLKNRKPDVWMDRKAKDFEDNSNRGLERYFELLDDRLINDEE